MTIASHIRSAFPNWKTDPYQKTAVDGLLRILFAAEAAQTQIDNTGTVIGYAMSDLPASLSFDEPARHAESLAKKLVALAQQLRKGAAVMRSLSAYATQFSDRGEPVNDDRGENHRGDDQVQLASNTPLKRDDPCPF